MLALRRLDPSDESALRATGIISDDEVAFCEDGQVIVENASSGQRRVVSFNVIEAKGIALRAARRLILG